MISKIKSKLKNIQKKGQINIWVIAAISLALLVILGWLIVQSNDSFGRMLKDIFI